MGIGIIRKKDTLKRNIGRRAKEKKKHFCIESHLVRSRMSKIAFRSFRSYASIPDCYFFFR